MLIHPPKADVDFLFKSFVSIFDFASSWSKRMREILLQAVAIGLHRAFEFIS